MKINDKGEITEGTAQDMICSGLYNNLIEIYDEEGFKEIMEVLECSYFEKFVNKLKLAIKDEEA